MTAAKSVYSTWQFNATRRETWKNDISESTCTATGSPVACDWRTDGLFDASGNWRIWREFVKKLRPSDEMAVEITGQYAVVLRRGGAACGAGGGGEHEPVPGDQPLGEEDRPERRAEPGAVSGEGSAAGGADEG